MSHPARFTVRKLPDGEVEITLLPPPREITNWIIMAPDVARRLASEIRRVLDS